MNVFGIVELTTARAARRQRAELARLRAVAVAGSSVGDDALARDLIAFADIFDDLLRSDVPRPAADTDMLAGLRSRVDILLALFGIAPLTDRGEVDFLRHEVVADRPAPGPELVDHIAEVVRPGYRRRDHLLRAQQVIAYRAQWTDEAHGEQS